MRTNRLIDELTKAVSTNSSSSRLLGPAFVASCPVLRDNEKAVVRQLAGPDVDCSYAKYDRDSDDLNACLDTALQARTDKLDLLDFASDPRLSFLVFFSVVSACNFV